MCVPPSLASLMWPEHVLKAAFGFGGWLCVITAETSASGEAAERSCTSSARFWKMLLLSSALRNVAWTQQHLVCLCGSLSGEELQGTCLGLWGSGQFLLHLNPRVCFLVSVRPARWDFNPCSSLARLIFHTDLFSDNSCWNRGLHLERVWAILTGY